MNRPDGTPKELRRAQAAAAVLSAALTFIFVAYLLRQLSSISDFDISIPILFGGVALSLSLFFLTRDQIKARQVAEHALHEARKDKDHLRLTIEQLQCDAKSGDTDM